MNESLVKYLAGLLDADGSLSFTFKADMNREGRFFVGLHMNLTASDAVDKGGFVESLPVLSGFGNVYRYGDRNQFAVWSISKRADLEMLIPRLVKHMVIKAQHWQWLLDMWRASRVQGKTISRQERDVLAAASKESRKLRVGPIKPKNFPSWAWTAGYLDGDGWYTYRHHKTKTGYGQWHMRVGAVAHVNDSCSLEFLQKAFGGCINNHSDGGHIKIWNRSLGYQNRSFALNFLPNLAKHSRLKRDKIDAIIHHHRQRLSVPGTERRFCEIDGCGRPRWGHGLCSLHYQRKRRECKRQSGASLTL